MIKQILERAIADIEAQKAREVSAIKERVMREKIVPYNNEINQSRDKAISELNTQLNSNIAELQKKFSDSKQSLIDAGEKKKTDFAEVTIATETAIVAESYDKSISKLRDMINQEKE